MENKVREKYLKVDSWDLNINLEEFLINKGFEFTIRKDWIAMCCPFPNHDDSNPSFFIHIHHLGYNCYSGCGSGSWSEFLEKMGWEQEEITDISVNKLPIALWKDFKRSIIIPEENLKTFHIPKGIKKIINSGESKKHFEYMKGRNIENLISIFNVCYTIEKDFKRNNEDELIYGNVYKNRIIIPCHNEIGKVIWLEGRYTGMKKIKNKYWRPKGVDKTKSLFNFHRVKKKGYRWVILVEGIIDAMILWLRGIPSVCCYGAVVSDEQLGLLMEFDKVYVCLDNDPAGIKGWLKLKPIIRQTGIEVLRIILPKRKDVNDISPEDFIKRYDRAKRL